MSPEPVLPALRGERTGSVLRLQSAATLTQERPKHVAPAVDKDESYPILRDVCRARFTTRRQRRPVTET